MKKVFILLGFSVLSAACMGATDGRYYDHIHTTYSSEQTNDALQQLARHQMGFWRGDAQVPVSWKTNETEREDCWPFKEIIARHEELFGKARQRADILETCTSGITYFNHGPKDRANYMIGAWWAYLGLRLKPADQNVTKSINTALRGRGSLGSDFIWGCIKYMCCGACAGTCHRYLDDPCDLGLCCDRFWEIDAAPYLLAFENAREVGNAECFGGCDIRAVKKMTLPDDDIHRRFMQTVDALNAATAGRGFAGSAGGRSVTPATTGEAKEH